MIGYPLDRMGFVPGSLVKRSDPLVIPTPDTRDEIDIRIDAPGVFPTVAAVLIGLGFESPSPANLQGLTVDVQDIQGGQGQYPIAVLLGSDLKAAIFAATATAPSTIPFPIPIFDGWGLRLQARSNAGGATEARFRSLWLLRRGATFTVT